MVANIQVTEQLAPLPSSTRIITSESLRQQRIWVKLAEAENEIKLGAPKNLDETQRKAWYAERERRIRELIDGKLPRMSFPEGFQFKDYGRVLSGDSKNVFEATQGFFGTAFSKRLEWEVDAGRTEEPTVYEPIYDIMVDGTFPKVFEINTLSDVGVIFTEVKEGDEVKFASVGKSSKTINIVKYAAGLEYTDDIFEYNYAWRLGPIEREFGKASNALMNDVHLSPILTASYGSANQTAAATLGATIQEKYSNTFSAAIATATSDTSNPRRGPYVLLCSLANLDMIVMSLRKGIPQQGFDVQAPSTSAIRTIIAYDGWSSSMGKKTAAYSGVTAGKCYLIHVGDRAFDFQSKVKIPYRRREQEGDLKRFIARDIVYDTHFGVYSAPTRAVEEITLPTS